MAKRLALLMLGDHTHFDVRPSRFVVLGVAKNNPENLVVVVTKLFQNFYLVDAGQQHIVGLQSRMRNSLLNMLMRIAVAFVIIDEWAMKVNCETVGHGRMAGSLSCIVRSKQLKMQVPTVLHSLRNNEEPSYGKAEWTAWTDVWEDEVELFGRLRTLYNDNPTPQNAQHWVAYVEQRRPIDWQYILPFFLECPQEHQSEKQLEVSSKTKNADPHIATMQLLYRYHTKQPDYACMLKTAGAMQHMAIEYLGPIAQDVWTTLAPDMLKPLVERLNEFFEAYPHAIDTTELPQKGVGLLMASMLMGADDSSYALNIGEEEKYYQSACQHALDDDILKIIQAHLMFSQWKKRLKHEFGINWFEPFLQSDNPAHLTFSIYQSLDPKMNLKQLAHFIQLQGQAPAETYALESINLS